MFAKNYKKYWDSKKNNMYYKCKGAPYFNGYFNAILHFRASGIDNLFNKKKNKWFLTIFLIKTDNLELDNFYFNFFF